MCRLCAPGTWNVGSDLAENNRLYAGDGGDKVTLSCQVAAVVVVVERERMRVQRGDRLDWLVEEGSILRRRWSTGKLRLFIFALFQTLLTSSARPLSPGRLPETTGRTWDPSRPESPQSHTPPEPSSASASCSSAVSNACRKQRP